MDLDDFLGGLDEGIHAYCNANLSLETIANATTSNVVKEIVYSQSNYFSAESYTYSLGGLTVTVSKKEINAYYNRLHVGSFKGKSVKDFYETFLAQLKHEHDCYLLEKEQSAQ